MTLCQVVTLSTIVVALAAVVHVLLQIEVSGAVGNSAETRQLSLVLCRGCATVHEHCEKPKLMKRVGTDMRGIVAPSVGLILIRLLCASGLHGSQVQLR